MRATLALFIVMMLAVQAKPELSISADRVKSGDSLFVTGKGFTPSKSVLSHLKRPDETEYNPLRIRTNDKGEFVHRIDSTMLELGAYEMWVEDEGTHVLSNRIRFTVTDLSDSR